MTGACASSVSAKPRKANAEHPKAATLPTAEYRCEPSRDQKESAPTEWAREEAARAGSGRSVRAWQVFPTTTVPQMRDRGTTSRTLLTGRQEPFVFGVSLVLALAGTFRFPYFSSWDGPAHAASAYGMWHYDAAIARLFRRDWFPSPNLIAHLYEAALVPILGPALADRTLAATCVVVVALGVRYLCRAIDVETGALVSYVALPLAFGWFVHAGQYSFMLGVGSATTYLGWRFRSSAGDRWSRSPVLVAPALVWLYLCHLVPFAIVMLVHLVVSLPGLRRRELRRVAVAWAPALPSFVLLAIYLVHSAGADSAVQRRSLKDLFVDVATLREVLVAFSTRDELLTLVPTIGCFAAFVGGLVWSRQRLKNVPAIASATVAGVLCVLYWILPTNVSGGGFLTARLLLFAVVLLAASAAVLPRRLLRVVPLVAVASLFTTIAVRQDEYRGFSADIEELMEARPFLGRDDVVLTLVMCGEREPGCASAQASTIGPLSQASGFFMAHEGAADLTLYEAFFPYFPLQFKNSYNPAGRLFPPGVDTSAMPPQVEVASYERATGIEIDRIVIWGWYRVEGDASVTRLLGLRRDLAGYREVYTSSRGNVTVFERL